MFTQLKLMSQKTWLEIQEEADVLVDKHGWASNLAFETVLSATRRQEFLAEAQAQGCSWYETQMLMFAYDREERERKQAVNK